MYEIQNSSPPKSLIPTTTPNNTRKQLYFEILILQISLVLTPGAKNKSISLAWGIQKY